MARNPRYVSGDDVRRWARESNWQDAKGRGVGERGRFSTELVEAFNSTFKRRNILYVPGMEVSFSLYDEDAPAPAPAKATPAKAAQPQKRNAAAATSTTNTKAVAAQSKASTPAARKSEENNVTPIRVQSTRGTGQLARRSDSDESIMGVAEAIEVLESMGKAKKSGGRPVLMTIQTLAYV